MCVMSSRSLKDLDKALMPMAVNHIKLCASKGVELLIYTTYRSDAEQDILYNVGRNPPSGKIVTNARAGQSDHNHVDVDGRPASKAYDCVPMLHGKPIWDTSHPYWAIVGSCGEEVGLVWSGRWTGKMKEMAHFSLTKQIILICFKYK